MPRKTPQELEKEYNDGLQGWIWNDEVQEDWEQFSASTPDLYTLNPEIKDLHKSRPRVLLYLAREKYDPGAFEQEAQDTGDCTSHGDRNARDITRSVEVMNGEPEIYYLRGATEPTYGARGHRGQGMDPARAARFVTDYGFLFRKAYRDVNKGLNVDLSKYNANVGINWGGSGVPDPVKEECKLHGVGQAIVPKSVEECLDLFAAGKACHSGQQWGTTGNQPSDGINRKRGSWNHDMGTSGYDFTREFFKEDVFFVHNTWGIWNERNPVWDRYAGTYGKWIGGTIVVPRNEWEDYFFGSGSIFFYSDIEGFPIHDLPYLDIDLL